MFQSKASGLINGKNAVVLCSGKSVGAADLGRRMRNWALDIEFEVPMNRCSFGVPRSSSSVPGFHMALLWPGARAGQGWRHVQAGLGGQLRQKSTAIVHVPQCGTSWKGVP